MATIMRLHPKLEELASNVAMAARDGAARLFNDNKRRRAWILGDDGEGRDQEAEVRL